MLKLVIVALLAHFAAGQQVININNYTDPVLDRLNAHLTKHGLGIRKLPDVSYPEVKLSKGYQIGLNSYHRTSDALLTVYNKTNQFVDLHLGLRLFALAYGSIKYENVDMSGVYRIRNNTFHVSYSVDNSSRCKVILADYQFDVMSEVQFESSIPKYNGDVSDVFSKYVLPRVNEKISHLRRKVEAKLQKIVCHPHHGKDHLNVDNFSVTLGSLMNF